MGPSKWQLCIQHAIPLTASGARGRWPCEAQSLRQRAAGRRVVRACWGRLGLTWRGRCCCHPHPAATTSARCPGRSRRAGSSPRPRASPRAPRRSASCSCPAPEPHTQQRLRPRSDRTQRRRLVASSTVGPRQDQRLAGQRSRGPMRRTVCSMVCGCRPSCVTAFSSTAPVSFEPPYAPSRK